MSLEELQDILTFIYEGGIIMNAIDNNVNYSSDQFNLKNISFKVPQGFVTGFIGRNGAGKTTIIRLIMDLYQPQTGVSIREDMALNPIELKE